MGDGLGWVSSVHSLKLTAKASENRPKPKRKVVSQPSIFRGELLVSGSLGCNSSRSMLRVDSVFLEFFLFKKIVAQDHYLSIKMTSGLVKKKGYYTLCRLNVHLLLSGPGPAVSGHLLKSMPWKLLPWKGLCIIWSLLFLLWFKVFLLQMSCRAVLATTCRVVGKKLLFTCGTSCMRPYWKNGR